jgi:hypothetical protein
VPGRAASRSPRRRDGNPRGGHRGRRPRCAPARGSRCSPSETCRGRSKQCRRLTRRRRRPRWSRRARRHGRRARGSPRPANRPGDRVGQRERLLLPRHDHERGVTSAAHQNCSAGGRVCGYGVARRLDRRALAGAVGRDAEVPDRGPRHENRPRQRGAEFHGRARGPRAANGARNPRARAPRKLRSTPRRSPHRPR